MTTRLVARLVNPRNGMDRLLKLAQALWQQLREACGENDYSRHRTRQEMAGAPPMTPGAFYLEQLTRKYSRPSRCC